MNYYTTFQTFQRRNHEAAPFPASGEAEPLPIINNPRHWEHMKRAYRRIERELESRRNKNNSTLTQ